jgi:hypothetical protein
MEAIMRRLTIVAAALAAAAAFPGAASAVTCYTVVDRNNETIYQDSEPPFDMSDRGAADRDALRARNEYLTIYDADHCPPVSAPPGATGYRPATVEEIVAGIRDYARSSGGPTPAAGGRGSSRGASSSAPARSGGSSSARKY